jgi:hypothetical protein
VFDRWPRSARLALLVALLAAESIWFFHAHYSGKVTFPFDFGLTYHAVPFYWQSAARAGHIPQWIPFQAFGYPLALNLQSGMYYPPLWVFPLGGLTYSLRAAAIFQCLHVVAGSLGAFAFARARALAFEVGLLAALAYGVFGGFFSNAQHVDIVRGYALLPWLLAALTLGGGRWRAWGVAPAIYLLVTGAYPGQWIAALVFGIGYLIVQLGDGTVARRDILERGVALAFGLGLAAIILLPGFALHGEVTRVDEVGHMTVTGFDLDHLFTTVLPYGTDRLLGDISMRSLYVTAPILFGFFMVRELRRHASLLVVAIAAFALASSGTLLALVARVFPPLGYSRFPAADYRALIALPLIVLGAHGLVQLRNAPPHRVLRIAGFAGFVTLGMYRLHDPSPLLVVISLCLIALAWIVPRWPLALVLVVPLLAVDSHCEHHAVEMTWIQTGADAPFKRYARELGTELTTPRTSRPARAPARYEVEHGGPDLDGYLRGHYTNDDYAASEHLRAVVAARALPDVSAFMVAASSPRILPTSALFTGPSAVAWREQTGTARSTAFSADSIEYAVSAPAGGILVENEPSIAGWHAELDCDPARSAVPRSELYPLRAWSVPAGTQRLCVRYTTPARRAASVISLLSLALFLGVLIYTARSRRP